MSSSGVDKRTNARHRRRIRVTLGGSPIFTTDVSAGGLCAELVRVLRPGSQVRGAVTLGTREFAFIGQVMWATPGDTRLGLRGRMGIQFQQVDPSYAEELKRFFP